MDNKSACLKKVESVNLLQQCMINLQKNFSTREDFEMSEADIFHPEFEFTCKAGDQSKPVSWNLESPYCNKSGEGAQSILKHMDFGSYVENSISDSEQLSPNDNESKSLLLLLN